MYKNIRGYHQLKVVKVSKNKFSHNICIVLNAFSGFIEMFRLKIKEEVFYV